MRSRYLSRDLFVVNSVLGPLQVLGCEFQGHTVLFWKGVHTRFPLTPTLTGLGLIGSGFTSLSVQLGVGPVAYQSNWEWVQWLISSIGSGSSG